MIGVGHRRGWKL